MSDIYPLTFIPIFKEKIWGGTALQYCVGRQLPPGKNIGESWEIVDRDNDVSIIANGTYAGKTLHYILIELKEKLIGTQRFCDTKEPFFPLLIKFLDATEKLSVQVHPDDALAEELHENDSGKTELWYILAAKEGAEVVHGCDPKIKNLSDFSQIEQLIENKLHKQKIAKGDIVYNPAGMVHALLDGTVLLEIQQNSDITYRLYDWGRERELHLDKGMKAIKTTFDEQTYIKTSHITNSPISLVNNQYFSTELVRISSTFTGKTDGTTYHILCVVEGEGTLRTEDKRNAMSLNPGSIILIPAILGHYSIAAKTEIRLLRVT